MRKGLCLDMNRIIAVDFDGTLCHNAWPDIGPPNEAVIDYVRHQQQTGAKIILWTNRTDLRLKQALDWCANQSLFFDAVNENLPEVIKLFGGDTRKVYADEYLDDKMRELPTKVNRRRRRT